jgi:hypothetical protein
MSPARSTSTTDGVMVAFARLATVRVRSTAAGKLAP